RMAIGNGYNFFEDCIQFTKLSPEEQLYRDLILRPTLVAEAIELVVLLADAYAIVKSDMDNSSTMLKEINQKLDVILGKLDELNRKMDEVIFLLENLPQIIRGEVDNALVQQALGECKGIVGNIQDKMQPKLIDQYKDQVEALSDALAQKLDGI